MKLRCLYPDAFDAFILKKAYCKLRDVCRDTADCIFLQAETSADCARDSDAHRLKKACFKLTNVCRSLRLVDQQITISSRIVSVTFSFDVV